MSLYLVSNIEPSSNNVVADGNAPTGTPNGGVAKSSDSEYPPMLPVHSLRSSDLCAKDASRPMTPSTCTLMKVSSSEIANSYTVALVNGCSAASLI